MQVFLRARNMYFLWMDQLKGLGKWRYFFKYLAQIVSFGGLLREKGMTESASACLEGMWCGMMGIGGPPKTGNKVPGTVRALYGFMTSWHPYFWSSLFRGELFETLKRRRMRPDAPRS